jgi:hypothetical protein
MLVLGRLLRLLLEARRRRRVGGRLTEPDGARRKQIHAFARAGRAEKIPGLLQFLLGCAVMNPLEETLFALRSRGARRLTRGAGSGRRRRAQRRQEARPAAAAFATRPSRVSVRAVQPGTNGKIHPDGIPRARAASKPPLEVSRPGNRTKSAVKTAPGSSGRPEGSGSSR